MSVELTLEDDEFILRGGKMEKSFVCKGLSKVSGRKFVKLGKTMRWVTFFATGEGPQQSPLVSSKVLYHIRKQAREFIKVRLVQIRGADDEPEAEVEDLSDRLGLAAMGLVDEDEADDEMVISKKSLKVLPKTMKVPLTILGAPANWAPVFVVDSTVGTRMELNKENLENLFAAFETEKPAGLRSLEQKRLR